MPLFAHNSKRYIIICILHNVTQNESETWPVKEEDVIRLEKNYARIVRSVYNGKSEDEVSAEELCIRLKLYNMKKFFEDRRLVLSSGKNERG